MIKNVAITIIFFISILTLCAGQSITRPSPEKEADYEDRTFPIPDSPPHWTLQFLMEQNDLRQADLVAIIGSRGRVSEVVNGKRAISKAQAKALGEFFKMSPELFI
jgi:antitoxin component HigA of HigAB toxin-antitoxin module